ncbi:hypothetical protein PP175_19090 [Aneurinibacillus sp. Ricciae_BoGa-3]|uniref:hypothetical protein n=1 Tax=Aneurinibacillus sp. Ricciae_BoGa-3 TaxID=3022697 RepID=UPI002341BDF8|nr:hypothetical protein [Aneurinibacillus sp. Ricciae_BoGa-3]WCK53435.1 hypothetical protein PP175_19090 [Aneurinibacillus sp. Ricciae_BoGa-3]
MDDAVKRIELLKDYGYPGEAIPSLLRQTEKYSYEKLKQIIEPYKDATTGKPNATNTNMVNSEKSESDHYIIQNVERFRVPDSYASAIVELKEEGVVPDSALSLPASSYIPAQK